MRIIDWSSDVCSSDLNPIPALAPVIRKRRPLWSATSSAVNPLRIALSHCFPGPRPQISIACATGAKLARCSGVGPRSEEHTSELQSLMRSSYAGFCLKKKNSRHHTDQTHIHTKHLNETPQIITK